MDILRMKTERKCAFTKKIIQKGLEISIKVVYEHQMIQTNNERNKWLKCHKMFVTLMNNH